MMDQLLERREEWNERRRGHITELRKRAAETEAKLKRLYDAIENGVVDVADPSLEDRIAELAAVRDQAKADAECATAAVERLGPAITPDRLQRFALAARRKLRNKDGAYRRDHLRALVQRAPTEIRIMGSKTELLRTPVTAASVERRRLAFAVLYRSGAPNTIRTCDLPLRRGTLYPSELPGQDASRTLAGGSIPVSRLGDAHPLSRRSLCRSSRPNSHAGVSPLLDMAGERLPNPGVL